MVGDYIRDAIARPWLWGENDCCTFMAGWVIARGNPDPMAFIRGRYVNEVGAIRRIAKGGGLVNLWTRGMIEAGVPEVDYPAARPGDVGVIGRATEGGDGQAGAIYTGDRWVSLGVRGIVAGPAVPLIVWRP